METLVGDGRIDPALTGETDPARRELPPAVAARVHLDSGLLQGAIPSQATYREDVFEFRTDGSSRLRQPLTDTFQWTLQTRAAAVVIEITPSAGGATKRLLLAPSAAPHRVFISNLPAESPSHTHQHHAMSEEEIGALHFGAYYNLLLHDPVNRPLPSLAQLRDRRGSGFSGPIFCPPAVFSR
jgi:hypothetical protein